LYAQIIAEHVPSTNPRETYKLLERLGVIE